jgi:hypothetical protein
VHLPSRIPAHSEDDPPQRLPYARRLEIEVDLLRSGLSRIAYSPRSGECGFCHTHEVDRHRPWCPRKIAQRHLNIATAVGEVDEEPSSG